VLLLWRARFTLVCLIRHILVQRLSGIIVQPLESAWALLKALTESDREYASWYGGIPPKRYDEEGNLVGTVQGTHGGLSRPYQQLGPPRPKVPEYKQVGGQVLPLSFEEHREVRDSPDFQQRMSEWKATRQQYGEAEKLLRPASVSHASVQRDMEERGMGGGESSRLHVPTHGMNPPLSEVDAQRFEEDDMEEQQQWERHGSPDEQFDEEEEPSNPFTVGSRAAQRQVRLGEIEREHRAARKARQEARRSNKPPRIPAMRGTHKRVGIKRGDN